MSRKTEQEARRDAEAKTGLSNVQVFHLQQEELRENGLLVDLSVHGVSQFYARVDWTLDLGIPSEDVRRERLTPGRKALIPDGKLKSLETRARRCLERHSLEIAAFGGYRYVPDTAFWDWKEQHDAIVQEWEDEIEAKCADWDNLVHQLEVDFSRMARETYLTLVGRRHTDDNGDIEEVLDQYPTMQSFVSAVVDKAKAKLPTRAEIRATCRIVVRPATFLLDHETEAMLLEAATLSAERQRKLDEANYWRRHDIAMAEEAEAKAKAAKQEQVQQEALLRVERIETERRERHKTEALREAQLEMARESLAEMGSPFQQVIDGLRSQILQTTEELLANVRKHGRVLGKTNEKATNMIAMFRLLNAAGDNELEGKLNELQAELTIGPSLRDADAVINALQEVANVAMTSAEEVIDLTTLDAWDMLEV
jgi:hypothetical protein